MLCISKLQTKIGPMILAVHALAGGVAGTLTSSWPIAIVFSLASHFILDAVPHWHYPVHAEKEKMGGGLRELLLHVRKPKDLARYPIFRDMLSAGLDFFLGLALLSYLAQSFHPGDFWLIVGSGLVGILPDFLTLLYLLFPKNRYLAWFRKIHKKIHSRQRLDDRHLLGISSQAIIVLLIIWLLI